MTLVCNKTRFTYHTSEVQVVSELKVEGRGDTNEYSS